MESKKILEMKQKRRESNYDQGLKTIIEGQGAEEEFFDFKAIDAIVDSYIPILLDIQKKYKNLSKNSLKLVTHRLNEALSQVFPILEIIEEGMLEDIFYIKGNKKENLIPILQAVQWQFGYLSKMSMLRIADHLNISQIEVFSVASFYTQFKFEKPGKHKITLCNGTACFVKGSNILIEAVEKKLGIKPGQTTEDRFFSFKTVACIGCCAISPSVIVDGEIHGKMKPVKLNRLIDKLKKEVFHPG
ncbi:MAG: NADH-quinone oxidoreductase subunit NuoE family protein [Candidatus Kariarchaeaceae archaeon]